MSSRYPDDAEWLEADGLGGFASGTVSGVRTRRYHALLLPATTPTDRSLVSRERFDARSVASERRVRGAELATLRARRRPSRRRASHRRVHPEPWPHWTFRLDDDTVIEQEIVARTGRRSCWCSGGW
jgi:hypothetical protein